MSKLATDLMKVLSEVDSNYGDYENPHFILKVLDTILKWYPSLEVTEEKLYDAIHDQAQGMFQR